MKADRLEARSAWYRATAGLRGRRREALYDKIYFLHIAKTAGTAFSRIFESSVPAGRFFEHMESRRELFDAVQRDGQPFFVSGHFTFERTKELIEREDVFSLTILREPAAQLLSHLRWVKYVGSPSYPHPVHDSVKAIAEALWETPFTDVDRLAALIDCDAGHRLFDNLHVRYLTGMRSRRVDQAQADLARQNLASFNLAFTLDQLAPAKLHLRRRFPRLSRKVAVVNAAAISERLDPTDPRVAALVEAYTRFDRQLYAAIAAEAAGRLRPGILGRASLLWA
jgi:hypothetical protein